MFLESPTGRVARRESSFMVTDRRKSERKPKGGYAYRLLFHVNHILSCAIGAMMKASLFEEALFFSSVQKLSRPFWDGGGEATTVLRARRSTLVAECNGAASVRSLP